MSERVIVPQDPGPETGAQKAERQRRESEALLELLSADPTKAPDYVPEAPPVVAESPAVIGVPPLDGPPLVERIG